MGKDLVSIITPMYKGEAFVGETIKGVLSQSYDNWEMIIVDRLFLSSYWEYLKKLELNKLLKLNNQLGISTIDFLSLTIRIIFQELGNLIRIR